MPTIGKVTTAMLQRNLLRLYKYSSYWTGTNVTNESTPKVNGFVESTTVVTNGLAVAWNTKWTLSQSIYQSVSNVPISSFYLFSYIFRLLINMVYSSLYNHHNRHNKKLSFLLFQVWMLTFLFPTSNWVCMMYIWLIDTWRFSNVRW